MLYGTDEFLKHRMKSFSMSCIYYSDFITLYFERLVFIPNQSSFDLAANIVAFDVNLAASLGFREQGDSLRGGADFIP